MMTGSFHAGLVGRHVEGGPSDCVSRGSTRLGKNAREDDIDRTGAVDDQKETRRFCQIHRNMGKYVDNEWVGSVF